jgi:hypothetical protein
MAFFFSPDASTRLLPNVTTLLNLNIYTLRRNDVSLQTLSNCRSFNQNRLSHVAICRKNHSANQISWRRKCMYTGWYRFGYAKGIPRSFCYSNYIIMYFLYLFLNLLSFPSCKDSCQENVCRSVAQCC